MFDFRGYCLPLVGLAIFAAVALSPTSLSAAPGDLLFNLENPTPQADDRFGAALDGTSDVIFVGDPADDIQTTDAGAVYAFSAQTGALLYTIPNPDPAVGDQFGETLAVLADGSLVVGAPLADADGADAGLVYLFAPGSAALLLTISSPAPAPGDRFGAALALSGDRIVVGAPFYDAAGADAGAVFLFSAATGTHLRSVPNPGSGIQYFGGMVAGTSDMFAVGHLDTSISHVPVNPAAPAYLFDTASGEIIPPAGSAPGTPLALDAYNISRAGESIAVAGPAIAPCPSCSAREVEVFAAGGVRIYRDFNSSGYHSNDYFGAAMSDLEGNLIIGQSGGSRDVYLFTEDGTYLAWIAEGAYWFNDGSAGTLALIATGDQSTPAARVAVVEGAPAGTLPDAPASVLSGRNPDGTIQLNWADSSTNESAFEVQRRSESGEFVSLAVLPANTTTYTDTAAPAGDPVYRVRAWNFVGSSAFSIGAVLPNPPANLTAFAREDLQIDLTWTDTNSAETFYAIERARFRRSEFVQIATVPADTTFYTDSTAAANSNFIYRVRAGNDIGFSPYSNEASVGTQPRSPSFVQLLTNPHPEPGSGFGYSVASVGDLLVVGAPWADSGAGVYDSGRVYVFDANTLALRHVLSGPTQNTGDRFGWSVGVVRGNILVGAPYADEGTTDTGIVYLFSGRTGHYLSSLRAPAPQAGELFGFSVAPAGDNVVIGATGAGEVLPDFHHLPGAIYVANPRGVVYRTEPSPVTPPFYAYGTRVAAHGDTIAAVAGGSPYQTIGNVQTVGAIRTWNWRTQQVLAQRVDGAFSVAPAPDGNFLVGAPSPGTAYKVNTLTGEKIVSYADPFPPPYYDRSNYGYGVAATGPRVAVTASDADIFFPDSGLAYLFDGATGLALTRFDNPSPGIGDRFGASICGMDNGNFAIGAPDKDLGAVDAGAVAIFRSFP